MHGGFNVTTIILILYLLILLYQCRTFLWLNPLINIYNILYIVLYQLLVILCVMLMLYHVKYAALSRRFKDAMEDYNCAQENFRQKNKEYIRRQLQYGKSIIIIS